jgi:thiosulfate dehydrogenase
VMRGDASAAATTYRRACARCHGEPRTGVGLLAPATVVVPTATEAEHTRDAGYDAMTLDQIFVEKARHGNFYGLAGVMPPFSTETLTDAQLADVLAFLNPQLRD